MWKSIIIPALILATFASPVKGQSIQGFNPRCTDAAGTPVRFIFVPQLSDIGISTVLNGAPVIELHSNLLSFPPLLQMFFYVHECEHHIHGDVLNGLLGVVDFSRESKADRDAIRALRDVYGISSAQAALISSLFLSVPEMRPFYAAGPIRAKWIRDCFATSDEFCGSSTAFKGLRGSSGERDGEGRPCDSAEALIMQSCRSQQEIDAEKQRSYCNSAAAMIMGDCKKD